MITEKIVAAPAGEKGKLEPLWCDFHGTHHGTFFYIQVLLCTNISIFSSKVLPVICFYKLL